MRPRSATPPTSTPSPARTQVPNAVYDRSSSIFLTALAIDVLNIVFEQQTIKLDCVLLPAFIKGVHGACVFGRGH